MLDAIQPVRIADRGRTVQAGGPGSDEFQQFGIPRLLRVQVAVSK
jgi:hypothetical protein